MHPDFEKLSSVGLIKDSSCSTSFNTSGLMFVSAQHTDTTLSWNVKSLSFVLYSVQTATLADNIVYLFRTAPIILSTLSR